jgi:hypothetical protein
MFFYLVYSLPWGAGLPSGKRNTRVFFIGWMIYTLAYILIQNLRLNGTLGVYADSIYTGFILMAVGDIATMAYLYKYKYGRLIFHEMGEDVEGRWKFDEETSKYSLAKMEYGSENVAPGTSENPAEQRHSATNPDSTVGQQS